MIGRAKLMILISGASPRATQAPRRAESLERAAMLMRLNKIAM